jgi:tRNAThr (cytosine32-N3)-methyltransferase
MYMIADELALLFTGSPAPSAQNTTQTTEVVEDQEDDGMTRSEASPSPTLCESVTELGSNSESISNISRPSIHPNLSSPLAYCPLQPLFTIEQLGVDRRLLVNRKRQLKMYRVWMQGKFRKLA